MSTENSINIEIIIDLISLKIFNSFRETGVMDIGL